MNESRNTAGLSMFASFMTGIVITGVGAFMMYPHDTATRQDVKDLQTTFQAEFAVFTQQLAAQQTEIDANRIDVARLKEKARLSQ